MEPYQILTLQVRVDLGVMTMKVYSIFPKVSRLELYHLMVPCHIQDTHYCGLAPLQKCSRCFYNPSRLSYGVTEASNEVADEIKKNKTDYQPNLCYNFLFLCRGLFLLYKKRINEIFF